VNSLLDAAVLGEHSQTRNVQRCYSRRSQARARLACRHCWQHHACRGLLCRGCCTDCSRARARHRAELNVLHRAGDNNVRFARPTSSRRLARLWRRMLRGRECPPPLCSAQGVGIQGVGTADSETVGFEMFVIRLALLVANSTSSLCPQPRLEALRRPWCWRALVATSEHVFTVVTAQSQLQGRRCR